MRRAATALLGTVVGTVLLVGAKYQDEASGEITNIAAPAGSAAADAPGATPGPLPTASTSPAAPSDSPPDSPSDSPSGSPSGSPAARRSAPGTPAATPAGGHANSKAPTKPAPRPSSPPRPPKPTCSTATSSPVGVAKPGIGAVTVTVKVCDGAVTSVAGTLSESNWSKNTAAVPALDAMAVQEYKTNFDAIHYSGASLTSNAYRASLRAALTSVGI